MPRTGRIVLANYPHHVVQRGHNREAVFAREQDYRRYLDDLRALKDEFDVRVYAYCLMTNHIHLLLAPNEAATGMGRLMKALAARATRHHNQRERRTGTLWESRYKSSLVQTDRYLMACCRYIELNPVRAGMVTEPGDYAWSSFRMRMETPEPGGWLDHDPCYLGLADTESARKARYAAFVKGGIPKDEQDLIRTALQRGQLTGGGEFVTEVSRITGRRVEARGQGRPPHVRTGSEIPPDQRTPK